MVLYRSGSEYAIDCECKYSRRAMLKKSNKYVSGELMVDILSSHLCEIFGTLS